MGNFGIRLNSYHAIIYFCPPFGSKIEFVHPYIPIFCDICNLEPDGFT